MIIPTSQMRRLRPKEVKQLIHFPKVMSGSARAQIEFSLSSQGTCFISLTLGLWGKFSL